MVAVDNQSPSRERAPSGMPAVIHLAPTVQVDSPTEPFVIEDLTGYEVVKGRYSLAVLSNNLEENLIVGERLDANATLSLQDQHEGSNDECREEGPQISAERTDHQDEPTYRDVTRAFSLLRSTSKLSDITFSEDKGDNQSAFACVRISL